MKKLLLALCIAALGVACRASGASMSDSSEKDCSSCTQEQMENCSDCSAKPECQSEQVCPVTGKSMN